MNNISDKSYKFYTIYKTTNKINGKFYVGQHMTNFLDDDYLGSGILLQEDIDKYGKCMFTKEILYVFDSYDEMNYKELEIVNIEFINRPDTYNMQTGGYGIKGVGIASYKKLKKIKAGIKAHPRHKKRFKLGIDFRIDHKTGKTIWINN